MKRPGDQPPPRRRGPADGDLPVSLAGHLLLSNPALTDENFHRTVVLISQHSAAEGALGVILNRPLGRVLGDEAEPFTYTVLADIPLYLGGPVAPQQVILAAWQASEDGRHFQLYFGIAEEKVVELRQAEPRPEMRAFLGYAGWTAGQLEDELEAEAWLAVPIDTGLLETHDGVELWKALLSRSHPEWRFLAEAPEDPELN